MPTPLRLREPPPWLADPVVHHGHAMHRVFEVGDAWYATPLDDGWSMYADADGGGGRRRLTIAPEHIRSGARPVVVVLPHVFPFGVPFCLHAPTSNDAGWGPSGWAVAGELPRVTVSPSIDMSRRDGSGFHGFVRNGVITP